MASTQLCFSLVFLETVFDLQAGLSLKMASIALLKRFLMSLTVLPKYVRFQCSEVLPGQGKLQHGV